MLDKNITILNIRESAHFPPTGNPVRVLVYTFTIGQFGPFTEEFAANEQHTDAVHLRLNKRAMLVRETSEHGPMEG